MPDIRHLQVQDYEKIIEVKEAESGLHAIVSVHNTTLGPAVGGTRLYPYDNREDALNDVLRLSRGMTYKSSLAGIHFGGGKSVIIARPEDKSPALLQAFAQAVDSLNGLYICAEDVNTTVEDMEFIRTFTPHVAGLPGQSGDPSPLTALGVFVCMEVTAKRLEIPINQLKVVVQGVGHVGRALVKMLKEAGADVFIADVNTEKLQKTAQNTGAEVISPEEVYTHPCDIFAPCAMGAVLNDDTVANLVCRAIVGSANNQLASRAHARQLHKRGILYATDYLVNAGGIINVYYERLPGGYNAAAAREKVLQIGDTLTEIYESSAREGITPSRAADNLAEARLRRHKAA